MLSLDDEVEIDEEKLNLINQKLDESGKFQGIKMVIRGSEEHIACLHIDTS